MRRHWFDGVFGPGSSCWRRFSCQEQESKWFHTYSVCKPAVCRRGLSIGFWERTGFPSVKVSPYPPDAASKGQDCHCIREGRAALSSARRAAFSLFFCEHGPVSRLLDLLWHEDKVIREAAALALAGGDRETVHAPAYGHFAGALLRALPDREFPDTAQARYQAVGHALRALLAENTAGIRSMSNMSYSFLSSALYLALLSTCRDAVEAVRRLRITEAHPELCCLLWNLSLASRTGRLNNRDVELLMQMTGRAMASLPPDEIPDFWHHLRHRAQPRRKAVTPALHHIADSRAVPYLTNALPDQPLEIAEPIIACLGRLGDAGALPALAQLLAHRNKQIRRQAQTAITAIERTLGHQARTLLRPVLVPNGEEAALLLRSLPAAPPSDPPEQLLRVVPVHAPETEAMHGPGRA